LSEVPRISVEELKERIDNGEAIVIGDTRGQSSYDTRHVAGAISIPFDQVESHVNDLPRDQEIVLYCT
jgi:rhodanese-related sulfurtransferase